LIFNWQCGFDAAEPGLHANISEWTLLFWNYDWLYVFSQFFFNKFKLLTPIVKFCLFVFNMEHRTISNILFWKPPVRRGGAGRNIKCRKLVFVGHTIALF
jgi:hypothetical protein